MRIHDEVHGNIELPNHIRELIELPIFQRLKKVRQLGFTSRVHEALPNHTRFEHCIGTYYCAKMQLDALRHNSEQALDLPDWCQDAVEIAALLHDVGHGPYSHTWERVSKTFNHERNSLICVERIFATAEHEKLCALRDNENGRGLALIKALIIGDKEQLNYSMLGYGYIFDIVHNRRCGLDVDKWDYLRRDNKRLGNLLSAEDLDIDDVYLQARIAPDGQRIEYRYEDYHRIYRLYDARFRLHIAAYRMPRSIACDELFVRMVHRNRPDLLQLNAESEGWLELHDEQVLEYLKNDADFVVLQNPERFIEVPEGTPDSLKVYTAIQSPGKKMLKLDLTFYGDASKKQNLQMNTEDATVCKWFQLKK